MFGNHELRKVPDMCATKNSGPLQTEVALGTICFYLCSFLLDPTHVKNAPPFSPLPFLMNVWGGNEGPGNEEQGYQEKPAYNTAWLL